MSPPNKRSTAAFTLIEVVLAALVLVAGLVGVLQVISSGTDMLDVSRKQTLAAQIIHSEIDNLRLSNWDQINALPLTSTSIPINASLQKISQNMQCFRSISLARTELKIVTITVNWTGKNGRPYTRSGYTYFGKYGLYVAYQRS